MDGQALATYPRDEVRGTLLRRTVNLGSAPSLQFKAGVDVVGRAWQLQVYVNDKKVLDKLIDGVYESRQSDSRHWEDISIDLSDYNNQ